MATASRTQAGRQQPQLLQAAMSALQQPDIRQKLVFTFMMLVIFRFVSNLPVPGINPLALDSLFQRSFRVLATVHLVLPPMPVGARFFIVRLSALRICL